MAEEEKDRIYFTPKQLGIILAIAMAVAGSVPTGLNKLVPEARHKPFTADDGNELDDRLIIIELQIDRIIENDEECKSRQDVMKSDLTWLRELVTTYQSSAKQRDETQDWKLEQCMRKLQ